MTLVVLVPPVLILAIYLVIGGVVVHSLVKPARKPITETPSESRFSAVEPVSLRSEDGVSLKGYMLPASGDRAILLVHGIYSHSWNGQSSDLARALVDAGFHVLVFDLRGHGRSGGEHLGLGWLERHDVAAATRFLLSREFEPGKIGIHGTSYGAATTLLATATIPEVAAAVGALVMDTPFANINDAVAGEIQRQTKLPPIVTNALLPGVRFMARRMYSLDFGGMSPEQALGDISRRPTLLIHGEDDLVTPVEHAMRLSAAAPTAELWILPGRQHTEGVRLAPDYVEPSPMREVYLRKVTEFFERSL